MSVKPGHSHPLRRRRWKQRIDRIGGFHGWQDRLADSEWYSIHRHQPAVRVSTSPLRQSPAGDRPGGAMQTTTPASTTTASTTPTSVPPAVTMGDLTHVALTVTDLSVSVPWYERVFNRAPVLDEDTGHFRHVAFALGSTMFGLHAVPRRRRRRRPVRPATAGSGPRLVRLPRPHHPRRLGNPAGPARHRARRDRRRRLRLRALLQRPRRTPTRGVLPTQRMNTTSSTY